MFVVTVTYTQPIEAIEARTAEHREWLDIFVADGRLLLAGPMVPRTGGVLIFARGPTKDEIVELLTDDPFHIHGLARYDVVEFNPGKIAPALRGLV